MIIMGVKMKDKLLIELESVLKLYDLWDQWIDCSECFLSKREIDSILYYQNYASHEVFAFETGLSVNTVRSLFKRTLNRLRYNHKYYRYWVADKILLENGIIFKKSEKDLFLIIPIQSHNALPVRLRNSLGGFENLEKVLEFDANNLKNFRGIGEKSYNLLIKILKENGCI